MSDSNAAGLTPKGLVSQLFWSSRPISWINTAFPFAAAYFFATRSLDLNLIIGTLFFLIPYNLLMYGVNDVFDYESDLRNPRKGGIEGALLHPKWHRPTLFWSAALTLPFIFYLLFQGDAAAKAWLLLFVFTVIAYSAKGLRFKEKPFLDSLTSASHFVGPMIYGLALAGASLTDTAPLLLILGFTLWGVASHAFGAVQDVKADSEAQISSSATVIGACATTRFAVACYALAGALVAASGYPSAFAAVAAVPYLAILWPHLNITDATCETANRGWKQFIKLNYLAGFIVTMITIWAAFI
ncbi:MAG: prenyltransferase [Micrococcales bacterium]